VHKNYLVFVLLGLLSFLSFIYPRALAPLSRGVQDFETYLFYDLNRKNLSTDDLVIVGIDDYSLGKIEERWPWSRALYARFLEILDSQKARVVGFDIAFIGREPEGGDAEFSQAIKNFSGEVVLAYYISNQNRPLHPLREFRDNALIGFVNVPADRDGKVRRAALDFKAKDIADSSWSLKLARAFQHKLQIRVRKDIPRNIDGTVDINYLAKPQDFTTVSFYDVISENFRHGIFKNKLVLVGTTAKIRHDIHPTPFGPLPGILINANIVLNILRENFYRSLPQTLTFIICILTLLFTAIILVKFPFFIGLLFLIGAVAFLIWENIFLKFYGWYFPSGQIIATAFFFFVSGSIYNYLYFLSYLFQLKNKVTKDPLTDLFNLRFFCERVHLELKKIPYRPKFLVVFTLGEIEAVLKGEGFKRTQETWLAISAFLYKVSPLWSRCGPNAIVGLRGVKHDSTLMVGLGRALVSAKINTGIKMGELKVASDMDIEALLPLLIKNLERSSRDRVFFKREDLPSPLPKRQKMGELLPALYRDAEEKSKELLLTIERLKEEEEKNKEVYFQAISSLVFALESKDPYTEGHSQRVCQYALLLADKLNLDTMEKARIKQAALLHDLGKIGIPDKILHKRTRLTDEEFSVIKDHELFSAKILEPIGEFKEIIPYILYHHENYDGSGYPHGLSGNLIPLGARIVAVADAFDALITGRDYKKAFSLEKTLAQMNKFRGNKLDPSLTDSFLEIVRNPDFKLF